MTDEKHEALALALIAERKYSVSRSGVVYSENWQGWTGRRVALCQKPGLNGYLFVSPHHKGSRLYCAVHRLVAKIYIDNPTGKPDVSHKNGIRTDNRVENLEWVTPQERSDRARINSLKGEHPWRQLTEGEVAEIKRLLSQRKLTRRKIAKKFNVAGGAISAIAAGKSWKHVA